MSKPIDAATQFVTLMQQFCPYLRRVSAGTWRCGLLSRATGDEPCVPEDWLACKLNNGGHPAKDIAEILT
jgi:hypothetical protein